MIATFASDQTVRTGLKEEALQFSFNQGRSSIYFLASSTLHPVKGKVKKFDGKILIPFAKDPSTGGVTLQIEASTLDTNQEAINKKMKESCLEVSRFPVIQFKSVEIRNGSGPYSTGQRGRGEILGLLDLHGVQKKISIPIEYNYSNEVFHGRGKVIVKMSDFQIPEPKMLFLRVKDEIEILFEIEAFPASDPSRN
jgi:polyisoprenoid-binding protein YceI